MLLSNNVSSMHQPVDLDFSDLEGPKYTHDFLSTLRVYPIPGLYMAAVANGEKSPQATALKKVKMFEDEGLTPVVLMDFVNSKFIVTTYEYYDKVYDA